VCVCVCVLLTELLLEPEHSGFEWQKDFVRLDSLQLNAEQNAIREVGNEGVTN